MEQRESVMYSLACLILPILTGCFELFIVLLKLNSLLKKNTDVFCVPGQI